MTFLKVTGLLGLLALAACSTESRQGEPCADADESWSECSVKGKDGREYCGPDFELGEQVWSACVIAACEDPDQTEPCSAGGTRYCASHYGPEGVELRWGSECVTQPVCTPGDERSCNIGIEGVNEVCTIDNNGVPGWSFDACNTPLVLNFDHRPLEFSARTAAAAFDIAGGGACMQPHWPAAATPWLAIDLDRNGAIDGGGELFGSGSRLAGGPAKNGFVALAALDSDGDGAVTPSDARWSELLVWADHDADRRSSPWELLPAASLRLERLDLEHSSRRRCDSAGNCAVERASFSFREGGELRSGELVDVHLACE